VVISLAAVKTEQHFSQQTNTSARSRRAQRIQSLSTCVFLSADTLSFPPPIFSLSLILTLSLSLSSPSHSPVGSDFEAGALGWQIDLLQTDDGPLQEYSEPGIF